MAQIVIEVLFVGEEAVVRIHGKYGNIITRPREYRVSVSSNSKIDIAMMFMNDTVKELILTDLIQEGANILQEQEVSWKIV